MSDTLKIKKALTILPKSTSTIQSPADGDLAIDTVGDLRQYSSSLATWDTKISAATSEQCSYKNLGDFSGSGVNGLSFRTNNSTNTTFSDVLVSGTAFFSAGLLRWSPNSELLLTTGPTIYQRLGNVNTKMLTTGLASYPAYYQNWSPDGKFIASVGASPFLKIYQRSDLVFSEVAGITQPTAQCNYLAWSPNGQYLTVTMNSSPYFETYKRSGTTFTKLSNPATIPTHSCRKVAWSNNGELLAIVVDSPTPSIVMYRITGDTFTQLSYYPTITFSTNAIQFSPDDKHLACGSQIYENNNGSLTAVYNISASYETFDCSWSSNGKYLYLAEYDDVGMTASNYIVTRQLSSTNTYYFSDDGAVNDLSLNSGVSIAIDISPNGEYIALAEQSQPFQIKRMVSEFSSSTPVLTSPKIKRAGT